MSASRRSERLPAPALALALVAVAFFLLPLVGLVWRAPWSDLVHILTEPVVREALSLSLVVSVASTTLALVFGVPLAWLYARVSFPAKRHLRIVTLTPMVLPPVVGGVALLLAFGRRGLIGQPLDQWFGISLAFSTAGAVLAATFVAMPLLVLTVESGFRTIDVRYEEAARTLGASRWTVFRRVTLPLLRPSLLAGTSLCWARALGEFGATITFAGNLPGETQTLPLAVYLRLQSTGLDTAVTLSLVLLALSTIVLVGLRDRWLGPG